MKLALASILLALGAVVPPVAHADPNISVDFLGQVQIVPGVPCNGCTISVEGFPLVARTNADGWFVLTRLPSGRWDAKVTSPSGNEQVELELRRPNAGDAPSGTRSEAVYLPTIVIARPGAVTGRVHVSSTDDLDDVVVGIPAFGLYVQPNIAGVYLLTGVPPGNHTVFVYNGIQRVRTLSVTVQAGALATRKDFPAPPVATPVER